MKFFILVLCTTGLMACAGMWHVSQPVSGIEKDRILALVERRPLLCNEGTDCEMKWAKAVAWLSLNAPTRLQSQTDLVASTYNCVGAICMKTSFTINQIPQGNGVRKILFRGGCRNRVCIPDPLNAQEDFINYVLGPETNEPTAK